MEYARLIQERYSVRKFGPEPVEESTLAAILEASRAAPTAVNKQPHRILVLREAKSLEKLKGCTPYTFDAPLALVVCVRKSEAWVRSYDGDNSGVIDAAIVGTHIMLAAHDLGLGTTWVGHFDPAAFRRAFNLPDGMEPMVIFPMGHPASDAKPSERHAKRRPVSETVVYETF